MEVHHHAHTARKKWTHYFWEFLMLFLAVIAGFLVENQREHYVEHQRAKVYASNLYEDLKRDTSTLKGVMNSILFTSNCLDTLCRLFKFPSDSITTGMKYYYGRKTTNVEFFSPNNITIEELKGSGNLRIMNTELAYMIGEYDKLIRDLGNEYQLSKAEFLKLEELHFRVFDVYYLELMAPSAVVQPLNRDSMFRLTDLPINKDPELIKEYVGWLKFESGIYKYQCNRYLSALLKAAEELIEFLEKKYHFK